MTRSAAAPAPAQVPRPRVRITRVRTADGGLVTVAIFLGPVRYVLHNGSADPGPAASGLDAASTPGGALTAEIPGQYRPAGQYLTGWTRDFFAVLGPPASPPATPPLSARLSP